MGRHSRLHWLARAASLATVGAERESVDRLAKQCSERSENISAAHEPTVCRAHQYDFLRDSLSIAQRKQLSQRSCTGITEAFEPRLPDAGCLHVVEDRR